MNLIRNIILNRVSHKASIYVNYIVIYRIHLFIEKKQEIIILFINYYYTLYFYFYNLAHAYIISIYTNYYWRYINLKGICHTQYVLQLRESDSVQVHSLMILRLSDSFTERFRKKSNLVEIFRFKCKIKR